MNKCIQCGDKLNAKEAMEILAAKEVDPSTKLLCDECFAMEEEEQIDEPFSDADPGL